MQSDRLVDLFHLMRQSLEDRYGTQTSEPPPADDTLAPSTLVKSKPVRRMLYRIGALRSRQPGKKTHEDAEAALWHVADSLDLGVVEVGHVFQTFAGAGADGDAAGICTDEPKCDECLLGETCRHYANRQPTLKELPESERPRERLLSIGPSALSDAELLALLINEGQESRTAIDLARVLLARAGGLRELASMTVAELKETSGIGDAKAARLIAAFAVAKRYATTPIKQGAAFRCSRDIYLHFAEDLRDEKREVFTCCFLDAKHRFLGEQRISIGTLMSSPVAPREVFRPAIRAAAQAVIFVHNHPSGDPMPSPDDLNITRRLVEVGKTIGIRVIDHVVIGNNEFYSFADKNLL